MQLCIYNQIWNLETLYFEKKEHLSSSDLKAGRALKAAGHGREAKTQLEQEEEKEKQGLYKPAKQLIIGSYY